MSQEVQPESNLERNLEIGKSIEKIPVRINYDIIRLFSEGLYKSPHKAIEELVSNSYDAAARNVRIVIPRKENQKDSLWVIDDGIGMDQDGLKTLWKIAYSPKSDPNVEHSGIDEPIGQFGIGKLASYVLARRITHLSKVDGRYLFVSMDFKEVSGTLWATPESDKDEILSLDLREVDQAEAIVLMSELERLDPDAWNSLFGATAKEAWTAAALTDLKDFAGALRAGTLSWVLSTMLPLTSNFTIHINSRKLEPRRPRVKVLAQFKVGGEDDIAASNLTDKGVIAYPDGVTIPGLEGKVTGNATLYSHPLTSGKSTQYGRSHGFFIRVRKRVVNMEDELFGLDPLNHAAWARSNIEISADGLREFLQSSREGVREEAPVILLRLYLHGKFNQCRAAYQRHLATELTGIDIERLLSDAPSALIRHPILDAVRTVLIEGQPELHYIRIPRLEEDEDKEGWISALSKRLESGIFGDVDFVPQGEAGPLVQYELDADKLLINKEHPFVAKLNELISNKAPITMVATTEVVTDAILREIGVEPSVATEILLARDKVLRTIGGHHPVVVAEAMRLLRSAEDDSDAMEKAVGLAFEAIGFSYTQRTSTHGHDGIIDAKLGRRRGELADYKAVYDTKTTAYARVRTGDIHFDRIKTFKETEGADFALVVGKDFQGLDDEKSWANLSANSEHVSVIRTIDLLKVLELHLTKGVTLSKIKEWFSGHYRAIDTQAWVERLEQELTEPNNQVPLALLLQKLEDAKDDQLATPSVSAVRVLTPELQPFPPERLEATLDGVMGILGPHWLELIRPAGHVLLNQSASQIMTELRRRLRDDFEINGHES